MISPIEHQVLMDDSDMQDNYLLGPLGETEDNNISSNSLCLFSDGRSPDLLDENDYDGSEFLQTENVGIVTPSKPEEKAKAKQKATPTKFQDPKKISKANAVDIVRSDSNDPAELGLPTKFDVLCGQSRICANHTGNRRFQVVLDIYSPKYEAAKSKQDKMMLTKEIVSCIATSGGRFLKFNDGMWVEISSVTARDKVSHALRTKVQSWKRHQEEPSPATPKKRGSMRKRRNIRRRSVPSAVPSMSEVRAVSFDGSTTSSTSIMDELLRTQREIFEKLTQNDKPGSSKQTHPLKRTETW
jgi:hypothetical protein